MSRRALLLRTANRRGSDAARVLAARRALRALLVQPRVVARVIALLTRRRVTDTRVGRTAGRRTAGVRTRRDSNVSRVMSTSGTRPLPLDRRTRMRARCRTRRAALKLTRWASFAIRARPPTSARDGVCKRVSPLRAGRSVSRIIALRQRSTSRFGKYAYAKMITHRLRSRPLSGITAYHLQTERASSEQTSPAQKAVRSRQGKR